MDSQELHERFRFHPANDITKPKHQYVRRWMEDTAQLLNESLPESREKSLVMTKLEEAMMWANAAIARALGD